MVRSMTGFGKGSYVDDNIKLEVEIKSVNNKYLDINVHCPKKLNAFDALVRNVIKSRVFRGKVDVYINYNEFGRDSGSLMFNEALARQYAEILRAISTIEGVGSEINPVSVGAFPDVITAEDADPDEDYVSKILAGTLETVLDKFIEARGREGAHLKENILEKLDELAAIADSIDKHEPEIMEAHRTRLREKLDELIEEFSVDENRVIAEMVIYSDKICTDEEVVRLKSHIGKVRDTLEEEGSIGRKLDFLAQELNREANTILSKAGDLITSDMGIALKTGIEKIREQIQNIE